MMGSAAGQMGMSKMMGGQSGKGPNPRHQEIMNKYGTGKDMSEYAGLGGLLNIMNGMERPQQQQQQGQGQMDNYIRSLLG